MMVLAIKSNAFRRAAGALVFAGMTCGAAAVSPASAGSSVSSNATVRIVRPAGVIGVQELSKAQGFLAAPSQSTDPLVQAAAPAARPSPAPPPSGGALAAAIAISGVPNQAFSLAITDSLVVVTDEGELVVTNFDHNAGDNPTIGNDGAAQISIGAKSQGGSPTTLQDLATNAGGNDPAGEAIADPNIINVTVQTAEGPQILRIQRPDSFGPTIFGEKFFTVLVSYN